MGELDPDHIHTPGCFVDYLVEAHTTLAELGSSASVAGSLKKVSEARMTMARGALEELNSGDVVNLGIGIPTLVADLITPEHGIVMHTENGMLGVGPEPESRRRHGLPRQRGQDPRDRAAGQQLLRQRQFLRHDPGRTCGCGDHGRIAGGRERQPRQLGPVPGKPLLGVGGAMDLASGVRTLIVTMMHTSRDGAGQDRPGMHPAADRRGRSQA